MDVLNKSSAKVWRFFGIPRSGNHAIIEWIMKNIDDSSLVFLNDCDRGDPTECFSYTNFDLGRGREKHRGNIHRDKNRHYLRLADAIEQAKNIAVSYEIFPVDKASTNKLWKDTGMINEDVQDIFIIRSPLNLLASCIKRVDNETTHKGRVQANTRNFIENQFSQYLGYLKRYISDHKSCIVYDQWGSDEVYRAEKLKHLGIEATDLDLGSMTSAGGGSSFDREQDVATISTSKRWTQSLDNVYFVEAVRGIKADEKLMAAILKIFPEDYAALLTLTA